MLDQKLVDLLDLNTHIDTYTDIWLNSIVLKTQESNKEELKINDTIKSNNYKIIDYLAIGGQSKVYLGSDLDNNKVVIKEFIISGNLDKNQQKRILKNIVTEAGLIKHLRNSRVTKFIDLFVEDNRAFLITDYVEGIALNKIPKDKINDNLIVTTMKQMLEILDYIHSLSPPIIHRDFTLDNLIINSQNQITLIDFNVACHLESKYSNSVPGKIAFMAPEQFAGNPCPQSDIYSFGASLYALITGIEPEPLTQLKLESNSDISNIIYKATQLSLKDRYQSAKEILQENIFKTNLNV